MNYQTVIKEVKEALEGQTVTVSYCSSTGHILIYNKTRSISFPIKEYIGIDLRLSPYRIFTKHGTIWNFLTTHSLDVDIGR